MAMSCEINQMNKLEQDRKWSKAKVNAKEF